MSAKSVDWVATIIATPCACMQNLQDELEKEPALALKLLAKAEDNDLPKCASVCEHFIAKSFHRVPPMEFKTISQAACLRILRSVADQRKAAVDKLAIYGFSAHIPPVASADTMLKWR